MRARAECPLQAFHKDTRVWKDQHLINGYGSRVWEANMVRTCTISSSSGLVCDCGILFPAKCIGLASSSFSSMHCCAPLGAEEGPTSAGISLEIQEGSWWLLEPCSGAWGPLPHSKTSAPAVTSSDKINLQLCCRRYKRALGWVSHAFLLLQSGHQSPQKVLMCLTSSHWVLTVVGLTGMVSEWSWGRKKVLKGLCGRINLILLCI